MFVQCTRRKRTIDARLRLERSADSFAAASLVPSFGATAFSVALSRLYARARFIAALAFFAAGDPSSASGAVAPAPPLETSRRYAAARRIAADAESADAVTADRRAFGSDAVFGAAAAAFFSPPPVPSSAESPVAFFLARLAASFSRLSLYAAARFIAAAALFACSGVDASNARGASPRSRSN